MECCTRLVVRWGIAWDAKRISIVSSSKTEHHAKRKIRIVPLLPAIETELLKLLMEAEDGAEFVFPDIQADTNLRTTLEKIIRRAGVKQWPKLWQNLRASGATDFARLLPSHVAAEICGHTEQIAQEHYWTVSDSDLDLAIDTLTPEISEKLATKLATISVSDGLKASLPVSRAGDRQTKKAPEIRGFDAICQLMTSLGLMQEMGDTGLEKSSKSQAISDVSPKVVPFVVPFQAISEPFQADADWQKLTAIWPKLNAETRVEILAIAENFSNCL